MEFGGKCSHCGYDRCMDNLTFHHRDPSAKEFGIAAGGKTSSYLRLLEEAKKCDLLCKNCHGEIHAMEKQPQPPLFGKEFTKDLKKLGHQLDKLKLSDEEEKTLTFHVNAIPSLHVSASSSDPNVAAKIAAMK
jgi:hypothetical protein